MLPAKPALPQPSPVTTKPVNWQVIKKGTVATDDLFTLNADQFNNLTANETEFLRFIKEAVAQLKYYSGPPAANVAQPAKP